MDAIVILVVKLERKLLHIHPSLQKISFELPNIHNPNAIPPGFYHNHDEDIKMIGVTPIESSFSDIKLDEKGTGDESTLARRHHNCSEGDDLTDKNDKIGFGEVKTLNSDVPTTLDYYDFNDDIFSLT